MITNVLPPNFYGSQCISRKALSFTYKLLSFLP